MVRKIIQLTKPQSEALERRAREQGVSFSEMIRRSVDLLLKEQPVMDEIRERAKAAVGYASSGDSDASVRHDDYLAEAYRQ
jgi:hypothetical protein